MQKKYFDNDEKIKTNVQREGWMIVTVNDVAQSHWVCEIRSGWNAREGEATFILRVSKTFLSALDAQE